MRISYILILVLFFGCDFTRPIHKNIIVAQNYISSGQHKSAIRVYENIVKRNPQKEIKMKMYYQLGELYSKNLIDMDKALDYYYLVSKISDDPLWLVKAEERISEISFSFKKDYKISIEKYTNLINFHPKLQEYDFYQYRLARSYYLNDENKKSLQEYEKIQKDLKHKFYTKSFFDLALIYFHNKKWKKSITYLEKFLERETKEEKIVEARFVLANCYEMLEELKMAYNLYFSILGKYPNTNIINNRLNSIYERRVARKY